AVASRVVCTLCAESTLAICSLRSTARTAALIRISLRSWAGVLRQISAPCEADRTAASTSAPPATGTCPTVRPSKGDTTSVSRPLPERGACHVPPISNSLRVIAYSIFFRSSGFPILNRSKTEFIGSRPTFWTGSKWDQCESSVIRIMSQEELRKFSAATGNSHLWYTPHEDLCEDEAMGSAVGDEPRASGSRPTIRDVAAAAGVSKSLVSLAFKDPQRVSEKRRQLILRTARTLG